MIHHVAIALDCGEYIAMELEVDSKLYTLCQGRQRLTPGRKLNPLDDRVERGSAYLERLQQIMTRRRLFPNRSAGPNNGGIDHHGVVAVVYS